MSDKASAAYHPYASREEALEAEVRALRAQLWRVRDECRALIQDEQEASPFQPRYDRTTALRRVIKLAI